MSLVSVVGFVIILLNVNSSCFGQPEENIRFLDSDTDENREINWKIPKWLDIQLNGKLQFSPKSQGVSTNEFIKPSGDSLTKINEVDSGTIIRLLNKINLDLANRIDNNIGFKSAIGVHYNPSNVRDGSSSSSKNIPKSCKEILENGHNITGLYQIQPRSTKQPIVVSCDMVTRDGGWTEIQSRLDGSQDFLLQWREYKFGFGDLRREFWIGLENIHKMTALEMNELLVELEDKEGKKAHAHYKTFSIGSEPEGYVLSVRGFSGDAGDSLSSHSGAKFSTKEFDQDINSGGNCALHHTGGWWFTHCGQSNLNGLYIPLIMANEYQGIQWTSFGRVLGSHYKSRMLIKPA